MQETLRHRTHLILSNEPPRQITGIAVAILITAMIVINVIAVILSSVPSLHDQFLLWFRMIEVVSAVFFCGKVVFTVMGQCRT